MMQGLASKQTDKRVSLLNRFFYRKGRLDFIAALGQSKQLLTLP
jgi:hypothetical protein